MERNLRLIAIVPPEPVYTQIRQEQEYIARTWGPHHALRTPPHITIIPPLSMTSAEVGLLYGMADVIAGSVSPFEMTLQNFGSFKPRVVFINPVVPTALATLYDIWHQAIKARMPHVLDTYPDRPYHPHLTLAHKDVTHRQYDAIWAYYAEKTYQASFRIEFFCILQHEAQGWVVERKYRLADLE